jgi:hypothetical protein
MSFLQIVSMLLILYTSIALMFRMVNLAEEASALAEIGTSGGRGVA